MNEHPRRVAQIEERIETLTLTGQRALRAAVHFATPANVLLGIHADVTTTGTEAAVTVRNRQQVVDASVAAVAAAAFDLAASTDTGDDIAMNVGVTTAELFTYVRSGAYVIAVGSDAVLGFKLMATSEQSARAFCGLDGGVPATGMVHLDSGDTLFVDGDENKVIVHDHYAPPAPVDVGDGRTPERFAAQVGIDVGEELGFGDPDSYVILGQRTTGTLDVEYLFLNSAVEVIVPATVGGTSMSIGVPTGAAALTVPNVIGNDHDGDDVNVPDGWSVLEPARFEPGVIAEHNESGIRALLRSTTRPV